MTRIIAGLARGRRLVVPAAGTRPTSDRAREGLFNSLQTILDLEGAQVLDLFAGSGAVGLEALSRGADGVVLVEQHPAAARVLHANITTVSLPGATVVQQSVAGYLAATSALSSVGFDFVFIDPPYALTDVELGEVLQPLCTGSWLRPEAVVVVERSARGAALQWPAPLEHLKQKRYGEAALWYGQQR